MSICHRMCVSMCLCVCPHVCVCVSMCVFSVQCVSECVQCVSECVHCTVSVNSCRPPLDLGPLIIMISKFYFLTIQNIGIMFSCFKTQIYFFFIRKLYIWILDFLIMVHQTKCALTPQHKCTVCTKYKFPLPPSNLGMENLNFLTFGLEKQNIYIFITFD